MNAKLFKNLAFVFCSALLIRASCYPPAPPSPKTKTQLITASPWKYSQAGVDLSGDGTIDQALPASLVPTCATDNVLSFDANKSGVIDEGATKCTSSAPQMAPFTWAFLSNETELDFSTPIFAGIGGTVKLIELTETKMTISKVVPVPGIPIPLNVVVVLVH